MIYYEAFLVKQSISLLRWDVQLGKTKTFKVINTRIERMSDVPEEVFQDIGELVVLGVVNPISDACVKLFFHTSKTWRIMRLFEDPMLGISYELTAKTFLSRDHADAEVLSLPIPELTRVQLR